MADRPRPPRHPPHRCLTYERSRSLTLSTVLREEERIAWQRLIRVLGQEINNSITPIKSIAGSLRGRLAAAPETDPDLLRGLTIIEDRASSLDRFL